METLITILVVDESADVRAFLSRGLNRLYPEIIVIESRTILGAISLVQSHIVTCVLTNYALPDGTAHAMLAIAQGLKDVPVIGMSSYDDHGTELLAAGAAGFLHKPFSLNQLVAVLEHAVSAFRSESRA